MTYKGTDLKPDSSGRARRTIQFAVNLLNEDDLFVHKILNWWKQQHRMATNIKKAILLFYDLTQGNTDRLCEYFPHIVEALTAPRLEGVVVEQSADLAERIDAIHNRLDGIAEEWAGKGYVEQPLPPLQLPLKTRFDDVEIKISDAPANRASAEEIAYNMAHDVGDLFAD